MPYIGQPPVTGDTTSSFRLLDNIASYTLTFDGSSSEVVSTTNDTLTFSQHRFVTGQRVTYNDGGGTAIGGLSNGVYFIIKVDQNTIKLAASESDANNNNAIDLTSAGVGASHTLNIAFDSVNTKFKVTYGSGTKAKISRAGQLFISINGVIQQPQESATPTVGFGLEADSTLVFSTAPSPSDVVFGQILADTITNFDTIDNTVDNFTGDGTTTIFSLSKSVSSNNDILVTIDGVVQYPTDTTTGRSYSVVESTLTFTEAPASSTSIQVRHIGFAGATSSAVTGFYGRTGNVVLTSADNISVQNITGVAATFTGNVSIAGTLTYEDVTNIDSVGLITARSGIEFGTRPGLGASISDIGNAVFAGVVTATSYYGDGSNLTGITSVGGDTGVDFNDNVKARFGTGNDLEIFHDGSNTFINEAGTGDLLITATAGNIQLKKNTGDKMVQANIDGSVDLYYANSKKFETTSGGIDVTGTVTCDGITSDGTVTVQSGTGLLNIKDTDNDGLAAVQRVNGTDSLDNIDWYVGQTSSTNNILRIFNINSDNIEFGTNNGVKTVIDSTGHLRPDANGTLDCGASSYRWRNVYTDGVLFNGDTAAANELDDYEEGTWTPQVLSGVTSPSYATQYGGYVKIGSLVYASWDIDLNGGTANTSHIQFGNFPFASESAAQQTFAAGVISYGTMFDQSTLHNLQLHMSWNGSTVVEVYNYGSTVRGNDSGVNILNRLIATIVYRTSA